jgi:hypothetical protein
MASLRPARSPEDDPDRWTTLACSMRASNTELTLSWLPMLLRTDPRLDGGGVSNRSGPFERKERQVEGGRRLDELYEEPNESRLPTDSRWLSLGMRLSNLPAVGLSGSSRSSSMSGCGEADMSCTAGTMCVPSART